MKIHLQLNVEIVHIAAEKDPFLYLGAEHIERAH